ncbi:hypothetical protein FISHEDRAFT_72010 [Fistulina hepatica ATCC 64428]|uniref:Uncharacterized protein n=1 Tax=Fistulina hepatica ATCC 64428 TaxID=1128425 RepID=A0A0D7AH02_9AGAR|nr:hypothetical protein FISHEDRAFT_72010 [Fistulina hepatica ATCC 64428]
MACCYGFSSCIEHNSYSLLRHPHFSFHYTIRFDPWIIEKNMKAHLKIVGIRIDATEMLVVDTIKEGHLGGIE